MGNRADSMGWGLLVIVAVVVLVGVPSLFTRDLWNPDEPRYMEVAREMVVLGDYVIPHLNGEVYSEKPPMFFWLAGQLWKLGGGYNSGRIVTIVATLLTLLLAYFFVARQLGTRGAILATVSALSTLLLFHFAKIGVLDPLLMLFTTSALVLGYNAFRKETRHPALCWVGCYAFMGFGTLTKGPVGILVPGLILLTYGLINHRNVRAGGKVHLIGALTLAAVVLAWLVPAVVQGGREYTEVILLKQNLGRFVRSFSHRRPFYYYALRWPMYFFPWSLVLPLAVTAAVRQWRRGKGEMALFAAVWIVVPLVFFSLVSGKRMNYLVPLTPAVGILTAWYFTVQVQGKAMAAGEKWLVRASFVILGVLATVLALLATSGAELMERLPDYDVQVEAVLPLLSPLRMGAAAAMFALPLALSFAALLGVPKSRMQTAFALAAAVLLFSLPEDLTVVPAVNTFKSGRTFAAEVRKHAANTTRVFMYGKDFSGVYNLYTGFVRMPEIHKKSRLKRILTERDVLVIGAGKHIEEALTAEELKSHLVYKEGVGHRLMLLLRGRGTSKSTQSAGLTASPSQADGFD